MQRGARRRSASREWWDSLASPSLCPYLLELRVPLPHFRELLTDLVQRLTAALAGRYTIIREIGAGGMATVYLAEDVKHHRQVALKVLKPDLAASIGAERFLHEIEIAARLHHPHVLSLYDSGQAEGFLFFVMPFVEGQSLRERVGREGALPVADVVRILRDVVDALGYAHEHGVVHRDIKPDNIMLAGRHALVADFGVAKAVSVASGALKLTSAGVALGTPTYMAPEQATADPHTDHRADIYAVGVVAYELLTGQPPFTGANAQAVLSAHLTQAPARVTVHRPAVAAALDALVMKCLEKQPADRWQSAAELLPVLESLATPSGGTMPLAPRRASSRRWPLVAAALVVVAGAAFAAWKFVPRGTSPNDTRIAVARFENRTGTDSLQPFGTIVADMLANGLSSTGLVSVVPTASVMAVTAGLSSPGASVDPNLLAEETDAGLIVSGQYFRRGDSLAIQAQIIDVARSTVLSPIALVVVAASQQAAGVDSVLQRVMVALSARVDPLLSTAAATSKLPMSMDAYREYATGMELYWDTKYPLALQHFYRAVALDSTSSAAFLAAAVTEWNANNNLPRNDSLLRRLEPMKGRLLPTDLAMYDFQRAWLDGDLEGALRASRRLSKLGLLGPQVQDAYRLNRLDEAYDAVTVMLSKSYARKGPRTWEFATRTLHFRGDHERELREARNGITAIGPDRPALIGYERQALAALGNTKELRPRLEALKALNPGNGGFLTAARELRHHGHSEASKEFGQLAVAWYRQAVADSTTAGRRSLLAQALYDVGDWEEARTMFAAIAAGDTLRSFVGLGYLGIDAARRGDTASAEAVMAKLHRHEISFLLGTNLAWEARIAGQLGQCERAAALLQEALRKGLAQLREVPEFARLDCAAFKQYMAPKK